jgi:signal transduction histidine kinase
MAVQVSFCPEPDVPLGVKEILYRILQEAIHNIVKHAHATQVTLVLDCSENQICLEVTDNGIGFDPLAAYPGHLGLQSMRERAIQCQGRIQIDSSPARGTKIQFVISLMTPLQKRVD